MAKRKPETKTEKLARGRRKAFGAACVQAPAQIQREFNTSKDAKQQDEFCRFLLESIPDDVKLRNQNLFALSDVTQTSVHANYNGSTSNQNWTA